MHNQRRLGECQQRGNIKETAFSAVTDRLVLLRKKKTKHGVLKHFYVIQNYELTVHNDAQKAYYFLTKVLEGKAFLVNWKCLRKWMIKKKFLFFTVIKLYSTTNVGEDLWMSTGPASLFKQKHLQRIAQDCVETTF